ncbi:hypothetical protein [Hoeflea sp. IMCC20628]|uniref:hypothetical protein n=1 Tax=Hoeflea sp. IMCC20628 TaxID=1620421 RepID=UPI0012E074A5|nr:hypothetical protein [Hoeflea sp. IMCC20628]
MPKPKGQDSFTRMQRAIQSSPIPEMIADLAAGNITPVSSTGELRMRYRKDHISEADATTCMTHACRAHALAVGSVLVVTDHAGTICFGVVPDPGLEKDDPKMAPVFRTLGKLIDTDHSVTIVAARAEPDSRRSVECPIFVMPAFEYRRTHGRFVEAYGSYLTSFQLAVPQLHVQPAPVD